eukprot:7448374-Pyramimonas_sp.AAC.3
MHASSATIALPTATAPSQLSFTLLPVVAIHVGCILLAHAPGHCRRSHHSARAAHRHRPRNRHRPVGSRHHRHKWAHGACPRHRYQHCPRRYGYRATDRQPPGKLRNWGGARACTHRQGHRPVVPFKPLLPTRGGTAVPVRPASTATAAAVHRGVVPPAVALPIPLPAALPSTTGAGSTTADRALPSCPTPIPDPSQEDLAGRGRGTAPSLVSYGHLWACPQRAAEAGAPCQKQEHLQRGGCPRRAVPAWTGPP